jgi:hypothetical protein
MAENLKKSDRKKNGRNRTTINEKNGRWRSETPFGSRKRK